MKQVSCCGRTRGGIVDTEGIVNRCLGLIVDTEGILNRCLGLIVDGHALGMR